MTLGFFPSIFDRPDKIRFLDQEDNEYIELLLRRHPITNIPWVFSALLAILVPPILFRIGPTLGVVNFPTLPFNLLVAATGIWYLLILAYILENFLHWYFNIYIVSNEHLIEIRFANLLSRNITSVLLDDIQSSSSFIGGIFRSLFNYGDVIIETAAERQRIEFFSVPRPDFVADRIRDLQEDQENKIGGPDSVT